ncbi:hypothetical protein KPH14_006363 [Odynerus spinipes]|uniref:Uncharacterized protein n=1 Tax=Odynerus spinipes TaxID=1348599 RepID=A0AAD9S0K4_9HYME|nr:hypothetical protein KPH14_006363 [Odynerus spinipes]
MTRGILTTSPTKLPSLALSYLPPRSVPSSLRSPSPSAIYANHKYDEEDVDGTMESVGKRRSHQLAEDNSYVRQDSRPTTVSLRFKDEIPRTSDEVQEILSSTGRNRTRSSSPRTERYFEISTKGFDSMERHRSLPIRSSYKVMEEKDEEEENVVRENAATDHRELYRGKKPDSRNPYRDSQDITRAIRFLDRFLSSALNGDSYNSELHLPPNPVLALVLSRYGRYVPGPQNPRHYSYMAVNNIHNNRPFGQYKLEREEEPRYVTSR